MATLSEALDLRKEVLVDCRDLLGLFQQAPGFVCFLRGGDLVCELANRACLELVGHRDLLGRPVREALPEVSGQGYFQLLDRVLASGEPFVGRAMRLHVQREPGAPPSEVYVDFVLQPIVGPDGRVSGILAQGTDVTETKRQEALRVEVEAALRASEERYRSLFEAIDDGYALIQVIFDAEDRPTDYRFIETNTAFEAHTGLRGAVGRTVRELVPGHDEIWFDLYGRVALTGERARVESHAVAMGRWFEAFATRVGAPEQRLVAVVFKDVTDRRRAEEEREQLLAQEAAARREAEDANRMKDDFLATVSHELRSPLSAMLGWVQVLRRDRALPAERRERGLETIERNARAQAQLVEDLLEVSRILSGKLTLDLQPVDLADVVEQAIESVRPAAVAKGISLQVALAGPGPVIGDATRLQQVVWNLVTNAVKFTPEGGRVSVSVERQGPWVEITVADSGRGISPAFLPHVFERFRQAEGGAARQYGGLGLGLSIVKYLVEAHGGSVSAESGGDGQGATFRVSVPLSVAMRRERRPRRAEPAIGTAACPPELDGLTVLAVDDEADSRDLVRILLESCNARVMLARDAEEGWRMLVAERPRVLISDLGMPGGDGFTFIERVRALSPAAGGRTPAVALTAYARAEDRDRALRSGFDTHLPKPFEPSELIAAIATLARRGGAA